MKTSVFLHLMLINFFLTACASTQPAPPQGIPQDSSAQLPASSSVPASGDKSFSKEELDQLLAPIALYPDALLAQILMASTYPLEIVSADRWVKANPQLKGKALEDALQQQPWDPSVKSLTVVPQVLTMMSEKIDWTQKLGDAFLAQRSEVMATVQELRKKAVAQGTLKDSNEQKVVTEQTGQATAIKIEQANPNVVYVPTYNPTVVYGAWPYPSYPPYYYYPPGYVATGAFFGFAAGAIVGSAFWGGCNWGGGDVDVNVNKYNNFNRTTNGSRNWSHNSSHRGAVPYRSQNVAQQYGRGRSADAASRNQYRGRSEAGLSGSARADIAGRDGGRDAGRGSNVGGADANRGSGARDTRGTRNASAFDTGGGAQTRNYSNRGSSSLGEARSSGNVNRGGYSSGRSGGGFQGGGGGGFRGGGGGGFRGGGGGGRR